MIPHGNPEGISQAEWLKFYENGGRLPDLGYGPGHHLGFEEEYEEHHWRKYHANDDPDVKIKHKEDIEHELLHHQQEIEETHDRSSRLKNLLVITGQRSISTILNQNIENNRNSERLVKRNLKTTRKPTLSLAI